jgi:hypothetical protein
MIPKDREHHPEKAGNCIHSTENGKMFFIHCLTWVIFTNMRFIYFIKNQPAPADRKAYSEYIYNKGTE